MKPFTALPLPPKTLRWGGPRYSDDQFFIRSGLINVRMLERIAGLNANTHVLDMGCGSARLLFGLINRYETIAGYTGVDVHKAMIDWANSHLTHQHPNIHFYWQNAKNARYNPDGKSVHKQGRFPFEGQQFDLAVLFSVFSHMRLKDIGFYLGELKRVLKPGGKIFLTAFVEYGVPKETENPKNYYREWQGKLHCVRLNRPHFEALIDKSGLRVDYFLYRQTNDGQSSYVLSSKDQPPFKAVVIPEDS